VEGGEGRAVGVGWGQTMKTELQPTWQRHDTDASTKTLKVITRFVVHIDISVGFYCSTVLVKIDWLTYRTRVSLPRLPLGDSTDLTMICPDNGRNCGG
jgi:hypothetical protein